MCSYHAPSISSDSRLVLISEAGCFVHLWRLLTIAVTVDVLVALSWGDTDHLECAGAGTGLGRLHLIEFPVVNIDVSLGGETDVWCSACRGRCTSGEKTLTNNIDPSGCSCHAAVIQLGEHRVVLCGDAVILVCLMVVDLLLVLFRLVKHDTSIVRETSLLLLRA